MQVCKSKKIKSLAAAGLVSLLLCSGLYAQSASTTSQMPEMPEMPSMPTIGGGFYTPSFPVRPGNQKKTNSSDNSKEKNESVLTEAITPESVINAALTKGNTLTASDISSLYDSGLFTNISSLSGAGVANGLSNYTTSTSTNVLLQEVLNSLN